MGSVIKVNPVSSGPDSGGQDLLSLNIGESSQIVFTSDRLSRDRKPSIFSNVPSRMIIPLTTACLIAAASGYGLPPAAMTAILAVEGGKVGQAVVNRNGSRDLGPFQVNSVWLDSFKAYWRLPDRETAERLLRDDGCANAWAAAAILKSHVLYTGRIDHAIARYHSATPPIGAAYLAKVSAAARKQFCASPAARNPEYRSYCVTAASPAPRSP
jgi:hypothetical protein